MPHSFSYAVSMNLEHSIKEGSHERYPDHFQCFRNIKKIKYPDFQAMTFPLEQSYRLLDPKNLNFAKTRRTALTSNNIKTQDEPREQLDIHLQHFSVVFGWYFRQ